MTVIVAENGKENVCTTQPWNAQHQTSHVRSAKHLGKQAIEPFVDEDMGRKRIGARHGKERDSVESHESC